MTHTFFYLICPALSITEIDTDTHHGSDYRIRITAVIIGRIRSA